MTRFYYVCFAAIICSLTSCNFSAGVEKDLATGLSYSYHGFRLKRVLLVDGNNNIMNSNKVMLNSRMAIVVSGISNYGLQNGKVLPGMTLTVTDKKGVAVIAGADLFPGNEGYPPEAAGELRGTITVAQPMRSGETYQVKMHVWDKTKADNTVDASVTLEVQ